MKSRSVRLGWLPILFGLWLLFLSATVSAQTTSASKSKLKDWPGKKNLWKGFERFEFEIDSRPCYVVLPRTSAPGNPWVWRARFPEYHSDADVMLLDRGYSIARMNTDGLLGSPRAMESWDKFYRFLVEQGMAKRCALEGVSRGGLFVYAFASRWPERVACIYCDTPVCDIRSWPGGKGKGRGHAATWKTCLQEYGLTEASAAEFNANPIDRLGPIVSAKIPILHIVSLNDEIVPPDENTYVLRRRFQNLGGNIDVIEVESGTKASGGHHFEHPSPTLVADFMERHATVLPHDHDYFEQRGALTNCKTKFETTGKGRVVFLGGSITTMNGWRDQVAKYLQERFPNTEFSFVDAGISSTGSVPGAFRLTRDVFSGGDVDLLFEEAAVNDLHNGRAETQMVRGMEGIVRHARLINPKLDLVVMHFVDPKHMQDYRAGKIPKVISQHERVAVHHNVSTINLAKEVTDRIDAGQFDWENDFKNCHPSPYGHRVYSSTIRRLLSAAWSNSDVKSGDGTDQRVPTAIDPFSYDRAKLIPPDSIVNLDGFKLDPSCDPRENQVGGSVRDQFHSVPMLVGSAPGDAFKFRFSGRAVGIFVAAGPDAGAIEFSLDGGPFKSQDLFTKWSRRLHIPWAYILADELKPGPHEIIVRVAAESHEQSSGTVCRIVNVLVNE